MARAHRLFPKGWLTRRWHSFLGLWLVVYLIEHLLTNSQAALIVGHDGNGYIRAANALEELPFIKALEILLIAVPFLYHGIYGIRYIFTAKYNSLTTDGRRPSLPRYPANHAYTWQRLAAWVLLVGIILHVIQMRFIDYPEEVVIGGSERQYLVRVKMDEGLYTVAARLGVSLFDRSEIESLMATYGEEGGGEEVKGGSEKGVFDPDRFAELEESERAAASRRFAIALGHKMPKPGQVVAASSEFGKASLLVVRNTFKDPWMILLYTLFVLAAVYHGFRGVWSFLIVWGLTLTWRSQRVVSKIAVGAMVVLGGLGLSAVWLTYWVNLRN